LERSASALIFPAQTKLQRRSPKIAVIRINRSHAFFSIKIIPLLQKNIDEPIGEQEAKPHRNQKQK
jgi:hypothetical protein